MLWSLIARLKLEANVKLITTSSKWSTARCAKTLYKANQVSRGIFHPLGAAFFSNASYPSFLNLFNTIDDSNRPGIEPFALAGSREMYRYNYTDGLIQATSSPTPQFFAAVSAEIPRYVALWTQRFAPISAVNYKVRCLVGYTKTVS